MWRSLARRAQDAGRLLAQGVTRCLCDTQKANFESQVAFWASSLRSAVAAMSDDWIQSLAKLADAKAKKLENATAKLRAAHWRMRVGAVVTQHGATSGPTKFSYQWVRGLAGWQRNPVGRLGQNDTCRGVWGGLVLQGCSQHRLAGQLQGYPNV